MAHLDPETVSLLGLGEHAAATDRAHLAGCDRCRSDVAALERLVAAARTVTPEDEPLPPPPRVWDGIADQLGLHGPRREHAAEPGHAPVATVTTIAPRRRTGPRTAWLVAAAGIVGIAGGALVTAQTTDEETVGQPAVVASAALAPLPGKAATGVATLSETDEASRTIAVRVDGPVPSDGYYEAWLVAAAPDGTITGLVSLGSLGPDNAGTFPVPEGLDLRAYQVVDVSLEPFDGDPAHSSDSLVRGQMEV